MLSVSRKGWWADHVVGWESKHLAHLVPQPYLSKVVIKFPANPFERPNNLERSDK